MQLRRLFVGGWLLVAVGGLAVTGCGKGDSSADCAKAVEHVRALTMKEMAPLIPPGQREAIEREVGKSVDEARRQCVELKHSRTQLDCVLAAQTRADVKACAAKH
jgi:hypothetical protein